MPVFTFFNGVLLARAMGVLLPLAEEGIINFSPEELSLVVSEPSGSLQAALRILSLGFTFFDCNVNSSAPINLAELYRGLNHSIDEDALTIYGGDSNLIHFQYHSTSTKDILVSKMKLPEIYNGNTDINEFQYSYEVGVCLPSEEFRNLIKHLGQFGSRVNMTVKKPHVTFKVGGVETTLSTWNNQCDISGVAEGDFLCSNFILNQMIWTASFLSNHVWIGSSRRFNTMLHYPLAECIAINIYFH